MTQSALTGRARPTRPGSIGRGPKVRATVLAATLAELAGTGYAALTVDNVARRAGVHKTTIYRRWKNRESLVTDAMTDLAATQVPFPDTGDIDTHPAQARAVRFVAFLNSPTGQAIAAAALSDASRIPEIADAKHRFFLDRFRRARAGRLRRHRTRRASRRHRSGRAGQDPGRTDLPAAPGHRRADRHHHGR